MISNHTYVRACPKWAGAYVVGPHVYHARPSFVSPEEEGSIWDFSESESNRDSCCWCCLCCGSDGEGDVVVDVVLEGPSWNEGGGRCGRRNRVHDADG